MIFRLLLFMLLLTATLRGVETPTAVISFNETLCEFKLSIGDSTESLRFRYEDVSISGDNITVLGKTLLQDSLLTVGDLSTNIKTLSVAEISERDGLYHVILEARQLSGRQLRRGAGDIVNLFTPIEITEQEFIRGGLISIGGDITIRGEVNGYVVSVFANIELKNEGICHRDVFAIGGSVKTSQQSRIYGAIQSTEKWKRSDIVKRRRIKYGYNPIEYAPRFSYNRVDGLEVGAQIEFHPEENNVPMFYFSFGYGLESERGKYQLGLEQRIFDYNQLIWGGSVYRQTKTADDWRSGRDENTAFAIINAEDSRDYWEGEGRKIYVEQSYRYVHKIRAQFSFEERDSLSAHPRLWSIFGGSKGFRSNFSSLPEPFRASEQSSLTKDEALLEMSYTFNSTYNLHQRRPHGWFMQLQYQHSSTSIDSEFSYDRYRLELRRYQPLGRYLSINLRALYGEATGSPPIHRLFYLGGIRTLRGHKIKEYYGAHAALINAEYVVSPREWSFGFAALFDLGVAGFDPDFMSDNRWAGDYGFGIWLGDFLRFELTRPFNGSSDDLRISVLADRTF